MLGIKEIIGKPPVFINDTGTKWWPHPDLASYAKKYPTLSGYKYWIIEDKDQERQFAITYRQNYVKTSQSIEDICLYIDMLGQRFLN